MITKHSPNYDRRRCLPVLGFLLCAWSLSAAGADDLLIKSGDKIAFLGDSITEQGEEQPGGYVRLIEAALEANGAKVDVIPAGRSGNTSKDMLARVEHDVIAQHPQWMTLSCGVNDVWHGASGVELAPYEENIRALVDRVTAGGTKVIVLTSTLITEHEDAPENIRLAAYNDFLRDLAKEKHLPLADLNARERAELTRRRAEAPTKGNLLTEDGVHMNSLGNEMMATGILAAMGFSAEQLEKQRQVWVDLPTARR